LCIHVQEHLRVITNAQVMACVDVARKYGAKKLVLFGSAAHDPSTARDIDLVCEGVQGWDVISMGAEMEEQAGACIDIVTTPPVTPFAEMALDEGKVLYESR
jgi:uncharacterized protein